MAIKDRWYVVTVGTEYGIFTRWLDVRARTDHISGARWEGFRDYASAEAAFNDARRSGEVRVVQRGPSDGRDCATSSRRSRTRSQPERQWEQQESPSTQSRSSRLSAASRAARDALIAATLEEAKRERRQRGWACSARTGGNQAPTAAYATASHSISAPAGLARAQPTHTAPVRQFDAGVALPATRASVHDPRARPTSDPSTSSSPPTQVTVHEHGPDFEPRPSPRHAIAISLSYESPTRSVVPPATDSSALSPVKRRSDISSPSTGVTKYFPPDNLTRAGRGSRPLLADIGSPASACYVTPPGSAETQCAELPDSPSALPVTPPSMAAPPTSVPTASGTRRSKVGKSYSEAAVQVDIQTRRRVYVEAASQAFDERHYATVEAQTAPYPSVRAAPLRATASAGQVLDKPRHEDENSTPGTGRGHTPLLGPSERRTESVISMASLQEGLNTLVPTSPSRSGSVAHETTFDPRSPIQRGTLIPPDSPDRNGLLRPSPMLLPLNSLLFS
ncbi:hypothetical protein PYCCODRAFT_1471848 [Trametes coccinea BRFM310]|uniref:Ribonuclease H1 N-terminal domain-containing protein n=1 Tax=Trametes coccinea (strain BRFM310) TaxID=1353009 RepID=A0A1Y2I8L7_TRAC3|nr:hypothetical protein PYCCODRAFT_1471848 [Trametes coccinea BRFM310]